MSSHPCRLVSPPIDAWGIHSTITKKSKSPRSLPKTYRAARSPSCPNVPTVSSGAARVLRSNYISEQQTGCSCGTQATRNGARVWRNQATQETAAGKVILVPRFGGSDHLRAKKVLDRLRAPPHQAAVRRGRRHEVDVQIVLRCDETRGRKRQKPQRKQQHELRVRFPPTYYCIVPTIARAETTTEIHVRLQPCSVVMLWSVRLLHCAVCCKPSVLSDDKTLLLSS